MGLVIKKRTMGGRRQSRWRNLNRYGTHSESIPKHG
jgi:hypothetical protein